MQKSNSLNPTSLHLLSTIYNNPMLSHVFLNSLSLSLSSPFSLYTLKSFRQPPGKKVSENVTMQQNDVRGDDRDYTKRHAFCINDHIDILIEVLKRLDGASLGMAACVCRLWCALARNDSLWEHLCFRHVSSPPPPAVRPVVVALGGYKRLYMVCVRPVLSRLGGDSGVLRRRVWTRDEVQLSLSLFCVDYYERLGKLGGGGGGGDASASSLMFLCKPVNV